MPFSIATWNINSVRLRLPLVERLLRDHAPDVLCLQETKCPNDQFPEKAFRSLGYDHIALHGQKGYHGVATISRLPFEDIVRQDFCAVGDARHLSTRLVAGGRRVRIHNLYVPAGGDEPDPAINPKFRHKLDFVEELRLMNAEAEPGVSALLVGDLNIAPLETDVWSHKQLLKVVSHTPVETEGLLRAQAEGNWADMMRRHVSRRGEALHLVELSQSRLDRLQSRPSPGSRVGLARPGAAAGDGRGAQRGAQLGQAVGPRAGDRALRRHPGVTGIFRRRLAVKGETGG
jgi:exodeoxyribonuclease-3